MRCLFLDRAARTALRFLSDDFPVLPNVYGRAVDAGGLSRSLPCPAQSPTDRGGEFLRLFVALILFHWFVSSKRGVLPELSYTAHASASDGFKEVTSDK